ncbi:hypothetical protein KKI23_01100 [Patescibacteria group bacterium]|nr:hypothetical protein [Patescibacteria group bacterium]
MPKRKEEEQFAVLGEKDCWHTYSLQMLSPTHFSKVVSKILDGNYSLVVTRFEKPVTQKLN